MKKYTKDDRVQVVVNEWVADVKDPFHYFELGEIVRVIRVADQLIYCKNSKGLVQALKPKHIKPIKNQ